MIDGVADDTQAFQRGVDYTAQNNLAFYVDEGVHLFNTATFKRWGSLTTSNAVSLSNLNIAIFQ